MKAGYKKYNDMNERYSAFIDGSKLKKKSKLILWEWVEERKANGFKDVNNIGLIGTIITIGEVIGTDFEKVTKNDIKQYFNNKHFDKASTELWYKKCLRRFYSWLADNKEKSSLFDCVRWIDTRKLSSKCSQESMKKREDNLLSPDDTRKMLGKATFLRDKLAIALLADTGVRAESIGASHNKRSINLGQIEFKESYAIIHNIEEKFDKKRDVVITESLSYLIKYYNEHPNKDNPKAPLFLNYSKNRHGSRWGYSGLKGMLHQVSKEAIGRIVNPHDFRHLKGTRLHLDEKLSDDAKCKLMGWSSRRMLDRYNHTTFNDAKEEYLVKKGIITIDKKKKKIESAILKPKQCPRCSNINTPTDYLCEICGLNLDFDKIIKDYDRLKKSEEQLNDFMQIPEVQKLFKVVYKMRKEFKEFQR